MSQIIVRFPPSPTGALHLGTVRTLLINYLFARSQKGRIVFRWEDTDTQRSKKEYEELIEQGLHWLGLEWDETHRQTENRHQHEKWIEKLWEKNCIFPCFVTPETIQESRKTAEKNRENFVFWSPDRDLEKSVAISKINSGTPYVWRWKSPQSEDITFSDLVRGPITVNTSTIGDFVIAKEKSALYLLANVLDDFLEGITHIIRGEDHISNTPKQILIFREISESIPLYAHIPLVLDQNKRKLSKRNVLEGVCVTISDFIEQGFLPEAVVNGIVFLGWHPKNTTEEIFSLTDLVQQFQVTQLNAASARYDYEKMKWFNAEWAQRYSDEGLVFAFKNWSNHSTVISPQQADMILTHPKKEKILRIGISKSKIFADIWDEIAYFFPPFAPATEMLFLNTKMKIESETLPMILHAIHTMLATIDENQFTEENIREKSMTVIADMELKNGTFLWPFRVALSARQYSASPFEIATILGKTETLKRITQSLESIRSPHV